MKHFLAIAGILAIAGCAGQGETYKSYFVEAGAPANNSGYGDAVTNNEQVMTGEKSYVINLARRFEKEVPSTVNFAFDSATLDPAAQAILRTQADWIRQFPEVRFRVYGHTDAVGPNAYNKRLGMRRALAVVNYLTGHGIKRSRLEAVVSYGETQPLIVTEGRERRNRRTVTEVTGFVKSNPIVMDGKYAEIIHREYLKSAVPASTLMMLKDSKSGSGGSSGSTQ